MSNSYLSANDLDYLSNFHLIEDDDSSESFSSGLFGWCPTGQQGDSELQNDSSLEPTPLAESGIVVVGNVPTKAAPWTKDQDFLDSLRTMLCETTSLKSRDCKPNISFIKNDTSAWQPWSLSNSASTKSVDAASLGDTCFNHEAETGSETSSSSLSSSCFRSSHVEQWNQRYNELVNFQKESGHCLVPLNCPTNPSLAHWVKRQRYQFRMKQEGKHSTMTDDRQAALESLGFVWDSHAAGWEERWNELRHFKERHGHCNVPKTYPENRQLAVWVKCQRRQYKLYRRGNGSNMTRQRIEKLSILGFVFDPRSSKGASSASVSSV